MMKNHPKMINKFTQNGANVTLKINPNIDPKKRRKHRNKQKQNDPQNAYFWTDKGVRGIQMDSIQQKNKEYCKEDSIQG